MKKPLMFASGILSALGLAAIATVAYAQDPGLIPAEGDLGGDCSFSTGVFGFHCFPLYIAYLIQLIFGFTGLVFLVNIIIAGFQIAVSPVTGDKDKGKERIRTAIIGFAVCVLSFLIVDFIVSALLSPV